MPISKQNRALYPSNWRSEIRPAILERAGHHCEECGVANYAYGARDLEGTWHDENSIHHMNSDAGEMLFGEFPDMIKIVLTIAHLDHNPTNNDYSNLRALCQRCHNRYDAAHRQANRARTLLAKRVAKRRAAQPDQLEVIL
jgi:5-methylcytosine-specific restriction endonuclease McrA